MNTEDLESKIEGGRETQSFEVKSQMEWDVRVLVKDILAMANVKDGGIILIGIEDGTFVRQGVSDAIADTYKEEIIKDQLAAYADPYVDISVHFPVDSLNNRYVVIKVEPFRQVPVICKKDSQDTRKGAIYYRNLNRRVESAAVSNAYDMRDIITMATSRTSTHFHDLGIRMEATDSDHKRTLIEELQGL